MIALFTDFGCAGPYVGQMTSVILQHNPSVSVVNLFSDAPRFNPRAASFLLAAYSVDFPADTVFLCVVDPGVGTQMRQPVIVRANSQWFVGPDNGLFNTVLSRSSEKEKWCITYKPKRLSNSFHGRDLFAPVAAWLASSGLPEGAKSLDIDLSAWPNDLREIVYVDSFGNLICGTRAREVKAGYSVSINNRILSRANTFANMPVGEAFWYENANGLVEIAVNQGRADQLFEADIGTHIEIIHHE